MFQKVLRYTGRHRKTTYASILVLVAGVAMSVLPYFFLYRLLRPLLTGGSLTLEETLFNAGAMALCMVLYGLLYVEGLALSHRSAYHTLENLRLHLQSKLEKQPLGAIQEKGVGVWKKMFIDDIESMELLLAHALPEGLSNLAVPVVVFAAMFLTDWKLGLLSLCSLPLGVLAMGMGDILAAKKVVLAATGLAKVPAIKGLIMDDVITTQNPSTMLKMHEDAVVVIDRELADAVGYRA